ncbi:COX15/CtaA family protein [Aquibacillus salsiterrae]|uniref:COX15/CtaA family protein n=1 Tax=Aquibacillus salsiterrae TaxID=2950439 RepID=A0A9X4AFA8_9BACI|nr:COX15/CtaA family protein [Aquibacillus salsiterrae]MDC3417459.1 COX15/CtaA family protein [Aquibacillus salsiterrae]
MRHRFSLFTTIVTFFALILGNLVVATNSGDACGTDWPKCNGNFFPDIANYQQVIEYSHRAFTGLLGFIILINAIIAIKRRVKGEKLVTIFAFASLFILILQSLVGGLNVLLGTPPGFTTIDVTVSLTLLVSLIFLTIALKRKPVTELSEEAVMEQRNARKLYYPAVVSISLLYFEIVLGAFFKHSAASKVMLDIPAKEQLISSKLIATALYDSHGIINTVVVISSLLILFYAYRYKVNQIVSLLYLLFITLTGLTGFLSVSNNLGVISTSSHMIITTITLSLGAILIGNTGFGLYVRTRVLAPLPTSNKRKAS